MPMSRSRSVMRLTCAVPVLPAKVSDGSSSLPLASRRNALAVPMPALTTWFMPSRTRARCWGLRRSDGAVGLLTGGGGTSSSRGVDLASNRLGWTS